MDPLRFGKQYTIHVYEMGPNGKLSLHSLFNYLQDIASDHAEQRGFGRNDLMKANKFWVLSRIYARIEQWPLWGDKINILTWPCGIEGLFALRKFEMRFPDGRYIGSASSSWLILDWQTKKIQRPDGILSHFQPSDTDSLKTVRNPLKLEPSGEQGSTSSCFRIKVSDLDINLHTNNVNYLKWVYDTYGLDFLMKNDPQSAEINYLAESKFNDEIMIRTSPDAGSFNHSICRIDDEKELCRIKLDWMKAE